MYLFGRLNKVWVISKEYKGETYNTYKMNVNIDAKVDVDVELMKGQYDVLSVRATPGTIIKFNYVLAGRNYEKDGELRNMTWAKCTEISVELSEVSVSSYVGVGQEPPMKHTPNQGLPMDEGPRPPRIPLEQDDDLPF